MRALLFSVFLAALVAVNGAIFYLAGIGWSNLDAATAGIGCADAVLVCVAWHFAGEIAQRLRST